MEYKINGSNIVVSLQEVHIDANVGESAKLDVQAAITYIKSGQAEINQVVDARTAEFNANAAEKIAIVNAGATSAHNSAVSAAGSANTAQGYADNASASAAAAAASAASIDFAKSTNTDLESDGEPSDDYVPTQKAVKTYVDNGLSAKVDTSSLATVAFTGDYDDLSNKPTLGTMAAESASDYTPTANLATVATSGSYNDLSDKPTIPTVNNATITITQGGVSKGSFTLNQSSNETIALDMGGSSYTAGTGIDITSNVISVAAPTLTNTATGSNSLTILGTAATSIKAINIGKATTASIGGVALGHQATAYNFATALGYKANANEVYAIQIGIGTNSESSSLYVGTSLNNNWKLLGSDGYIPNARINMDSTPTSASANAVTSGGVYTALASYATTNYVDTADGNLQSQIDAITAASDVTDIVGTYAELQAYDTSTLPNNSIIKVLQDESRDDETTYYRWVITNNVGAWVLIGEEGPYYTKSQADSTFVPQTRTVNNKALNSNITLSYSDVGADASGAASTAETNAKNYADGLASNYATAAQGALADTALQPNDNITQLTNNAGYITSSALSGYATETWVGNQGYQLASNIATTLTSTLTDSQYPSGKLFFDTCGDIETLINAL